MNRYFLLYIKQVLLAIGFKDLEVEYDAGQLKPKSGTDLANTGIFINIKDSSFHKSFNLGTIQEWKVEWEIKIRTTDLSDKDDRIDKQNNHFRLLDRIRKRLHHASVHYTNEDEDPVIAFTIHNNRIEKMDTDMEKENDLCSTISCECILSDCSQDIRGTKRVTAKVGRPRVRGL